MISHAIALDMRKRAGQVPPRVTLRRGESSTQSIAATITLDGSAYAPKLGAARLCVLHADGTFARVAAGTSDNVATATLGSAATNGTGRCRLAYFEFYSADGSKSETTQAFELVLEGNVDAVGSEAKNYDNELDALYRKMSEFNEKAESQETARVAAETKRVSAETARAAAETKRVSAEIARETASATAVSNAGAAAAAANDAAAKATAAAESLGGYYLAAGEDGNVHLIRRES